MMFSSPPRSPLAADGVPPPPSPARSRPLSSSVSNSPMLSPSTSMRSPTTLERIVQRIGPAAASALQQTGKRAVMEDISNATPLVAGDRRTRPRTEPTTPAPSGEEESGDKVAVQRFTLVSRDATGGRRAPPEQKVLTFRGSSVAVCRCSDCDRSGIRRRMSSGKRLCRRDTECHPEYALLVELCSRFEEDCPDRVGVTSTLVTEACCREKTAYFILGANNETVGYVAAEVQANRRVKRLSESISSDFSEPQADADDEIPILLQVYVLPESRRKNYATEALNLLLRDHQSLRVESPLDVVVHLLAKLGFNQAGSQDGEDGRTLTNFTRTIAP